MLVVWPGFLAACALEVLVFSVVDPHDLHWFGRSFALSRHAVYSGAFLIFWLVSAGASLLTVVLSQPVDDQPPGRSMD